MESKNSLKRIAQRYTDEEDMAIVKYMTTEKRYLKACGLEVWKTAEKMQICPGRPYSSLKERYCKTIVKNLKDYKVDKALANKIVQFMRASTEGKRLIRLKEL